MTTRNFLFALIIGIFCTSLVSCNFNFSSQPCNNKEPKKEVRNLGAFSEIDLSTAADIKLSQGTPQKFEIEGPTCDLENIVTNVNGSKLSIENEHNLKWGNRNKVVIYITVQDINSLSISGSGSIIAQTPVNTTDLRLNISGSGSIVISNLKAINTRSSIAGSGSIELAGTEKMDKHKIDIAGSGDIKAKDIPTSLAEVDIAGSGNCYLNVLEKLKASIAGSGDIYYLGRPAIESSTAGSGKIKSL
jgi:hypothetical protein